MILSRLKNAIREQNWFAVVLELAIVIVGVLIALAANDWADAQQARRVETESLRELRAALANDLNDVRWNRAYHQRAADSALILQEHMQGGRPHADSLDPHFAMLAAISFSVRDETAYETLKQRGMATVTNDSLRIQIGRLYGVEYETVLGLQDLVRQHIVDNVIPSLAAHFTDHRDLENATPIDYAEVTASPTFRYGVAISAPLQSQLARALATLEASTVALIASLDTEIARLE